MKSPYPALILFLLSGIVVFFFSWPSYLGYVSLQTQLAQKNDEAQTKEKYFNNLSEIRAKLAGFEGEVAKVRASLPDDALLPSLYNEVEGIAATSGFTVKELSSSPVLAAASSSGMQTIDLSVTIEGPYSGLRQFLEQAQNASRMLRVDSVNFSSPKAGDKKFSIQVRLSAFSY